MYLYQIAKLDKEMGAKLWEKLFHPRSPKFEAHKFHSIFLNFQIQDDYKEGY